MLLLIISVAACIVISFLSVESRGLIESDVRKEKVWWDTEHDTHGAFLQQCLLHVPEHTSTSRTS